MLTYFAPAGRDTTDELRLKRAVLDSSPLVNEVLESFPLPVLVLNANRQAVAANRAALELLGADESELIGRRPGEIFDCHRWRCGPDGCGTSPYCLTCGAVQAVLESQDIGGRATRECHVAQEGIAGRALDLRVTASLLTLSGERFSICTLEDISDQKRLAVLSRLFFHDVLNTAGCIQGYSYMLAHGLDESGGEIVQRMASLGDQLVEEIQAQRDLLSAESGDLAPSPRAIAAAALVTRATDLYKAHSLAQGRQIALNGVCDGLLETDERLALRVLGNMIKNALEATPLGATVEIGCRPSEGGVVFNVTNPGVIPEAVQLQLFQRSFSTKGQPGRGIGTYSMRLLGERYLQGRVSFASDVGTGTTFSLWLPTSHRPSLAG